MPLCVRWKKQPCRRWPRDPIPSLVPCSAAEVLADSNTEDEMWRLVRDYFSAGTEVIWIVDPDLRQVRVHLPGSARPRTLVPGDTLDGGHLLPGLAIPVAELFANLPEPE